MTTGVRHSGSLPESRAAKCPPHLAMEPSSPCLSSFACLTTHVTYRQTKKCKHAKTTEAKQKENTLVPSGATRPMQPYSKQKTHTPFFFFFFHCQARVAGELQIHIHSAALGGCYKLFVSVLTLIGANEQHSHVLSKAPQTGGEISILHTAFAVFHKRTDAAQSQVVTTNFTRRFLYNSCFPFFFHHLDYFGRNYF